VLASIYFVALFTVCVPTFKKGYVILGILGIFLPFLWLIGAVLPDRRRLSRRQRYVSKTAEQLLHRSV